MIFTLPLVEALARSGRYAEVAVAATPAGAEIVRLHGQARVIVDDKRGADRGPLGMARVCGRLRAFASGAPLDLFAAHRSARTALLALGSGASRRIGLGGAALAGLAYPIRARGHLRDTDAYLSLAAAGGVNAPSALPHISVTPSARTTAASRFGPGPILGLVLGSRRATKDWPELRLADALGRAAAHGFATVCLLGGPDERARAARLRAGLAGNAATVVDTTGEPLAAAAATLSSLDVVVGPDSGLTHLARAVGTPVLILFGPTDERRHAFSPTARSLVRDDLPCRPCHPAGPRRCPLGHHACMNELTADSVLAEAMRLVSGRPTPS